MNSRAYVMPVYPVIGYGIAVKYAVFRNLYRFSADWCQFGVNGVMVKQDKPAVSLRKISYPYIYATYSLMVFIVGISTDAILYLTVTSYKLLLASYPKSPVFS